MVYNYNNRLQPQVGSYLSYPGNGKQYGEDINHKIWEKVICNKIEELVVIPKILTLKFESEPLANTNFIHRGMVSGVLTEDVRRGLSIDLSKLEGTGINPNTGTSAALAAAVKIKPAIYINGTNCTTNADGVVNIENDGGNVAARVAGGNAANIGFLSVSKFVVTLDHDDPSGQWNSNYKTTSFNEEHASRVSGREYFKKLIQDYASLCVAQTFYSDWETQKDFFLARLDDIENNYDKIDKKEADKVTWERKQDKLSMEIKSFVTQLRKALKFPANATTSQPQQFFASDAGIDRLIAALNDIADKVTIGPRGPSRPLVRSAAPPKAADGAFTYI